MEEARVTFRAAAHAEAAHVERVLAERVAETSAELARKLAERPVGIHRVSLVVAFGALCINAGYHLAGQGRPFWADPGALSGAQRVLASVLRVPAGWMIFAFLVPAFVHGGKVGWGMVQAEDGGGKEKVVGWLLMVLSVVGALGLFVVLAKVTGV
jgi:hypothetical protein